MGFKFLVVASLLIGLSGCAHMTTSVSLVYKHKDLPELKYELRSK